MKTTTFFPINLPRLPGVSKVVDHIVNNAVGSEVTIKIDGEVFSATITSMKYINNGFEIITEVA